LKFFYVFEQDLDVVEMQKTPFSLFFRKFTKLRDFEHKSS